MRVEFDRRRKGRRKKRRDGRNMGYFDILSSKWGCVEENKLMEGIIL